MLLIPLCLVLMGCERVDRRAAEARVELGRGEVRVELVARPAAGERLVVRTSRLEDGKLTLVTEEALPTDSGRAALAVVFREITPEVWRGEEEIGEQWLAGVALLRAVAVSGEARLEFVPAPRGASRRHEVRWRGEVWTAAEVRAAFGEGAADKRLRRWVR